MQVTLLSWLLYILSSLILLAVLDTGAFPSYLKYHVIISSNLWGIWQVQIAVKISTFPTYVIAGSHKALIKHPQVPSNVLQTSYMSQMSYNDVYCFPGSNMEACLYLIKCKFIICLFFCCCFFHIFFYHFFFITGMFTTLDYETNCGCTN